jgi:hypothetical protein
VVGWVGAAAFEEDFGEDVGEDVGEDLGADFFEDFCLLVTGIGRTPADGFLRVGSGNIAVRCARRDSSAFPQPFADEQAYLRILSAVRAECIHVRTKPRRTTREPSP